MTRTGRKLGKAEGLEFAAHRRLVDGNAELLEQPLDQVLAPPAHHAMNGRNWAAFHKLSQRLALRVVQFRPSTGRFGVHQSIGTALIEAHDPVTNDLYRHAADLGCILPGPAVIDRSQSQKPANLRGVPGFLRKPSQRRAVIVHPQRYCSRHAEPPFGTGSQKFDDLGTLHESPSALVGISSLDAPDFRALAPFGLVPVIEDGGFVLSESNSILRYLANKHVRRDLLPDEPEARGRVEMWMDWQATEFNNSWRPAFLGLVRKRPEFQDEQVILRSMAEFNAMVGILDGQLERTCAYVAGEAFSLADIPIGLSVHRWRAMPLDKPNFAHVEAYYQRLCDRPAFARYGKSGGP